MRSEPAGHARSKKPRALRQRKAFVSGGTPPPPPPPTGTVEPLRSSSPEASAPCFPAAHIHRPPCRFVQTVRGGCTKDGLCPFPKLRCRRRAGTRMSRSTESTTFPHFAVLHEADTPRRCNSFVPVFIAILLQPSLPSRCRNPCRLVTNFPTWSHCLSVGV